jgi:hypothetical protein
VSKQAIEILKLGLCFSYKHVLSCMTKMARFTPGQWQQTQLQANCVRKEADIALRASATMLIKYIGPNKQKGNAHREGSKPLKHIHCC